MLEVDLDFASEDPDREARDREPVCVLGAEARPDVEFPAVSRTDDDRARKVALTQRIAGVWAAVLNRVDLSVDSEQADIDAIDLYAKPATVGNVALSGNSLKRHADLRGIGRPRDWDRSSIGAPSLSVG